MDWILVTGSRTLLPVTRESRGLATSITSLYVAVLAVAGIPALNSSVKPWLRARMNCHPRCRPCLRR